MKILALDPSGTSLTGYFLYENWNKYEFGSISGKNYLSQAKNLESLLKKEKVEVLIWETSFWWKTNFAQPDLKELVYLNGVLGWLAEEYGCESQQVLNHSVKGLVKQISKHDKVITGLELKDQQWSFKNQPLNEHERDALVVFWIYWVRMLRREWPFA
jgi:hypothetical protein